jgi:glycosyltransferase involved in cell wall biosynthesis
MKVAILHYWFLLNGGGENVVSSLLRLYPEADVYCLFARENSLPPNVSPSRLHCSFLNGIPFSHKLNRALLPLYPAAVGSFDFSQYDVIISSDSPPIKAIVTPVDAVHVSYCHTPGRFIWDSCAAFQAHLPRVARPLFAWIADYARTSDFGAAQRIDYFVANSRYIQQRIWKYYRRKSAVIHPPVDTEAGYLSDRRDDYYLYLGRLTEAKRVDLLIHACNALGRRLVIAGTGRNENQLKAIAGKTVEFRGRVSDAERNALYANCRAFLFAADEDFGIAPVEAQSFGRPVIAYGHGGSLETVRVNDPEGRSDTGVFFAAQDASSVADAILRFEGMEEMFFPADIQHHARRFDTSVFLRRMEEFVERAVGRGSSQQGVIQPIHPFPAERTGPQEFAMPRAQNE